MNKYFIVLVLLSFVIMTGACNTQPTLDVDIVEITPPAVPDTGQASIAGRVVQEETGEPISREIIRLAEVFREGEKGAYVLDLAFSPGTRSDSEGYFLFENITAMEYVIVVGNPEDAHEVLKGEDGTPRVWNAVADQVLDVGVLEVDF